MKKKKEPGPGLPAEGKENSLTEGVGEKKP